MLLFLDLDIVNIAFVWPKPFRFIVIPANRSFTMLCPKVKRKHYNSVVFCRVCRARKGLVLKKARAVLWT